MLINNPEVVTLVAADGGALIAFDRGEKGWLIDDFAVPDDAWPKTGVALLRAAIERIGATVTVVCAHRDEAKRDALRQFGLQLREEWWVRPANGADESVDESTADFSAKIISAPPVYDPGGPVLMSDALAATPRAIDELLAFGSAKDVAVMVVSARAHDLALRTLLNGRGFTLTSEWYRSS